MKNAEPVPNIFEVVVRNQGTRGQQTTEYASIKLNGEEVCGAFVTADGLLIFVEYSLPPPGKVPQGLDAALGQLILSHGRKNT